MRTYFRGDSRPNLFREGFKIKDEKAPIEKHAFAFYSCNAISMSQTLEAAAAFPYNEDEESYIYIIRHDPVTIYDLYSKSLQELKCDNVNLIRLSWANEQVSEKEIPAENLIGRMTVERFFKSRWEDVTPYDSSPLIYFKIKNLQINPLIHEEKFTIPEKLLFKKIRTYITNEDKIQSYTLKVDGLYYY